MIMAVGSLENKSIIGVLSSTVSKCLSISKLDSEPETHEDVLVAMHCSQSLFLLNLNAGYPKLT
jgi:hypothetical protein